jgi:hypothetical protein
LYAFAAQDLHNKVISRRVNVEVMKQKGGQPWPSAFEKNFFSP